MHKYEVDKRSSSSSAARLAIGDADVNYKPWYSPCFLFPFRSNQSSTLTMIPVSQSCSRLNRDRCKQRYRRPSNAAKNKLLLP